MNDFMLIVADAGADSYDRTDKLAGHTDTMSSGPPPYSSMDRGDKHNRRPGETEPDRGDMTEDRRDKMLGNHVNTELIYTAESLDFKVTQFSWNLLELLIHELKSSTDQ